MVWHLPVIIVTTIADNAAAVCISFIDVFDLIRDALDKFLRKKKET